MLRKTGVALLISCGMALLLAGCPKKQQNLDDPYEVDETEVGEPDLPDGDNGPDGPRGPDGPL